MTLDKVALRHPLAMVYGGGGILGIAYTAGVAAGLAATGIQAATAPALGTSAGSWTAAAVALGLTFEDFKALGSPWGPELRVGSSPTSHGSCSARPGAPPRQCLCRVPAHRSPPHPRRWPLPARGPGRGLVRCPGLLAPHPVDGRLYVDGGIWSATSVDAAAEADHVIVVAPLAGTVLGPLGRTAGRCRGWSCADGGPATRDAPSR